MGKTSGSTAGLQDRLTPLVVPPVSNGETVLSSGLASIVWTAVMPKIQTLNEPRNPLAA